MESCSNFISILCYLQLTDRSYCAAFTHSLVILNDTNICQSQSLSLLDLPLQCPTELIITWAVTPYQSHTYHPASKQLAQKSCQDTRLEETKGCHWSLYYWQSTPSYHCKLDQALQKKKKKVLCGNFKQNFKRFASKTSKHSYTSLPGCRLFMIFIGHFLPERNWL